LTGGKSGTERSCQHAEYNYYEQCYHGIRAEPPTQRESAIADSEKQEQHECSCEDYVREGVLRAASTALFHLEERGTCQTKHPISNEQCAGGPQRTGPARSFPKYTYAEGYYEKAIYDEQRIDLSFGRSANGHQLAHSL